MYVVQDILLSIIDSKLSVKYYTQYIGIVKGIYTAVPKYKIYFKSKLKKINEFNDIQLSIGNVLLFNF